jgi:hypothetical protein
LEEVRAGAAARAAAEFTGDLHADADAPAADLLDNADLYGADGPDAHAAAAADADGDAREAPPVFDDDVLDDAERERRVKHDNQCFHAYFCGRVPTQLCCVCYHLLGTAETRPLTTDPAAQLRLLAPLYEEIKRQRRLISDAELQAECAMPDGPSVFHPAVRDAADKRICNTCHSALSSARVPACAHINVDLEQRYHGQVIPVLADLTEMERRMIAPVRHRLPLAAADGSGRGSRRRWRRQPAVWQVGSSGEAQAEAAASVAVPRWQQPAAACTHCQLCASFVGNENACSQSQSVDRPELRHSERLARLIDDWTLQSPKGAWRAAEPPRHKHFLFL